MIKVKTIKIKHHQIGIDPIIREQITEKNLQKLWQRTRIQHYKTKYNKLNNKIEHQIKTQQITGVTTSNSKIIKTPHGINLIKY